jgi:MtN3 and saliva related transmembrane protein
MNDTAWYAIGSVAALLTSFGFVPQVAKIWRTKSVRDVSPVTFGQFALGTTLWAIYGVHLKDGVIVAANVIAASTVIVGLLLYFRLFKKQPEAK